MFARLTRFGGTPEQMDESLRHLRERIIPRIQQQDGYNGFIALGEREAGEVIGISLWEVSGPCRLLKKKLTVYGRRPQKLVA